MCSRPCVRAHLREPLLQTSVGHCQSSSSIYNRRHRGFNGVWGKLRRDQRQRQHELRDVQVGARTRKGDSIECSTSDPIDEDFQRIGKAHSPKKLRFGLALVRIANSCVFACKTSDVQTPMVALGKFNALHLGHRELIYQASRAGYPCLLSFSGMSKVC